MRVSEQSGRHFHYTSRLFDNCIPHKQRLSLVNDNILTLMSQIILDGHFAPEYLELPRYALAGFVSNGDAGSVPHMYLLKEALSDVITLRQVSFLLLSLSGDMIEGCSVRNDAVADIISVLLYHTSFVLTGRLSMPSCR